MDHAYLIYVFDLAQVLGTALPDVTLLFYLGLDFALRVNPFVTGLGSLTGNQYHALAADAQDPLYHGMCTGATGPQTCSRMDREQNPLSLSLCLFLLSCISTKVMLQRIPKMFYSSYSTAI